jgi:hypothetical protein
MEKLVYVLWRPEATPSADFASGLRAEVAGALLERSAGPVSLLLADAQADEVAKAAIRRTDPPIAGMVSCWLDSADERGRVEELLTPRVARASGYLVSESVPIRNRTHRAGPGERTPGITMLSLLERPERLSFPEWLRVWHERHTPLAIEIQCTYLYIRNVVVRALGPDAPAWAGIVEEGFPTEAVTNPMLWYEAGSKEQLQERIGRMVSSVRAFLDIDRVESLPMSEYVLRE